jgi:hypothetical protein
MPQEKLQIAALGMIGGMVTQSVCRVLGQVGWPQEQMYCWAGTSSSKKVEA